MSASRCRRSTPGVMEEAEAGTGYIGYYDGGAFGIPHSSKNKEAALLFLAVYRPALGPAGLGGRRLRASPTRRPTTIPKVKAMDEKLDGYYTLHARQG